MGNKKKLRGPELLEKPQNLNPVNLLNIPVFAL
jgi:hypothetical protein